MNDSSSDDIVAMVYAVLGLVCCFVPSAVLMMFREGSIGLFQSFRYWLLTGAVLLPWLIAAPVVCLVAGKLTNGDGQTAAIVGALMLVVVAIIVGSILATLYASDVQVEILKFFKISTLAAAALYGLLGALEVWDRYL